MVRNACFLQVFILLTSFHNKEWVKGIGELCYSPVISILDFLNPYIVVSFVFNFQADMHFMFIFAFLLIFLNGVHLITTLVTVFFCLNWMTLALHISNMIEKSIWFQGPLFLKCLLWWIFKQAKVFSPTKEKNNKSLYLFNNFSYGRLFLAVWK